MFQFFDKIKQKFLLSNVTEKSSCLNHANVIIQFASLFKVKKFIEKKDLPPESIYSFLLMQFYSSIKHDK